MGKVVVKSKHKVGSLIQSKADVTTADMQTFIRNSEKYAPVKLETLRCEYGRDLEFGVDPDPFGKIQPEEVDAVAKWYRRKKQIYDEKEARRRALRLLESQKRNGTLPKPWFRPALHSVWDNLQTYFDDGYTSFQIMTEIKERAAENILKLEMQDTGYLADSLTVSLLNAEEQQAMDMGRLDGNMSDESWKLHPDMRDIPYDDAVRKDWKPEH